MPLAPASRPELARNASTLLSASATLPRSSSILAASHPLAAVASSR